MIPNCLLQDLLKCSDTRTALKNETRTSGKSYSIDQREFLLTSHIKNRSSLSYCEGMRIYEGQTTHKKEKYIASANCYDFSRSFPSIYLPRKLKGRLWTSSIVVDNFTRFTKGDLSRNNLRRLQWLTFPGIQYAIWITSKDALWQEQKVLKWAVQFPLKAAWHSRKTLYHP